jgi:REP-associated tyrosine transposase
MTDKYNDKYRISSIRLQNWNYGWEGAYFITICTQNREYYFGNILGSCMELSPVGVLADQYWLEIKNHANNIKIGPYVVMPDHIHGVLILGGGGESERHTLSQQTIGHQRFQNQGKNTISSIIGSYKSAITRQARCMGIDFAWQSRFYDHIIRDEKSFNRIEKYIIENPLKWNQNK